MQPKQMKLEDIKPEYRKGASMFRHINLKRRIWRWLVNLMFVGMESKVNDPSVAMTVVDLGTAQARVFVPSEAKSGAGLVWIHGGGMVIGRASYNDGDCVQYAKALGAVVVSVEYRLAPKHPYPAAIDDCYAVWTWFLEHADEFGVDPNRIAISGQSAGGGLSAALCQRVLDEGGVQPACQCLFYPMLDDRTATNETLSVINHLGWNNKNNHFGWSAYLGQPAGSVDVQRWAVPGRREDLTGLPPAWIGVGDKDLFFEENKAYAARLMHAGIPCELVIVQDVPHGFDITVPDVPTSQQFRASALEFLQNSLRD